MVSSAGNGSICRNHVIYMIKCYASNNVHVWNISKWMSTLALPSLCISMHGLHNQMIATRNQCYRILRLCFRLCHTPESVTCTYNITDGTSGTAAQLGNHTISAINASNESLKWCLGSDWKLGGMSDVCSSANLSGPCEANEGVERSALLIAIGFLNSEGVSKIHLRPILLLSAI